MVAQHFAKHGGKVREQPFSGVDPRSGARVEMVNLIGSWFPDRRERVVLSAHYDTRPRPDEERDPAKRDLPFIGANDCASGVALLMEIAQHLDKLPTPWGVDLVLFDGEELVYGGGPNVEGEFFLGSKEFARIYVEGVDAGKLRDRYAAALLFDMIGGSELKIRQEENSVNLAPGLVKEIWAVAKQQKAAAFKPGVGQAVQDDHLPLNNAGIPAIDIIEWPYKYWHTSQDLPKNCSAASLEQVGKVVTAWLAQPKKRTR
jgi:Zn-dependent M28 family amino/carboxypeptidase